MNINLVPFMVVWGALILVVFYLYLRHRSISKMQDVGLNVLETTAAAQQHGVLAQQLSVVDRWGKTLTVLAAVYGLVLAAAFFYQSWVRMSNFGG